MSESGTLKEKLALSNFVDEQDSWLPRACAVFHEFAWALPILCGCLLMFQVGTLSHVRARVSSTQLPMLGRK